jgi:hypothetical protein
MSGSGDLLMAALSAPTPERKPYVPGPSAAELAAREDSRVHVMTPDEIKADHARDLATPPVSQPQMTPAQAAVAGPGLVPQAGPPGSRPLPPIAVAPPLGAQVVQPAPQAPAFSPQMAAALQARFGRPQ